jgi:hypothetical protein
MGTCETLSVIYTSNPSGGLVDINVSDYDPAFHIIPGAETPPEDKPRRGRPKKLTEADNGNC